MRVAAILLWLTACSSTDPFEKNMIEGGPGQDINVYVADVDNSTWVPGPDGSRQYTIHFEVSNNSNVPLTVTRITVRSSEAGAFQITPTTQLFNEMLDPGAEHIFEVRARGRLVRGFRSNEARRTEFLCIVALANGDSYMYTFEGPVRDDRPSPT
jgi:hypothetical protein